MVGLEINAPMVRYRKKERKIVGERQGNIFLSFHFKSSKVVCSHYWLYLFNIFHVQLYRIYKNIIDIIILTLLSY